MCVKVSTNDRKIFAFCLAMQNEKDYEISSGITGVKIFSRDITGRLVKKLQPAKRCIDYGAQAAFEPPIRFPCNVRYHSNSAVNFSPNVQFIHSC
jgi:hypothetical protein